MSSNWSQLIGRAEKLIGGPTPFINLSSLLTSEAGFLASRARRLAVKIDHPLFSVVRFCLHGKSPTFFLPLSSKFTKSQGVPSSSQRPVGSLVVLLIGQSYSGSAVSSTKLHTQFRQLAELFETVHAAISIHKSVVNTNSFNSWNPSFTGRQLTNVEHENWMKDLEVGNKLTTLAGDVLLSSVSTTLANFYNPQIVDLVSESIGHVIQAEFSPFAMQFALKRIDVNIQVQSAPDVSQSWLEYVNLSRGSILGSCCQSAVLLSDSCHHSAARDSRPVSSADLEKQEHPCVLARRVGQDWASLVRLIEERDFVRFVSRTTPPPPGIRDNTKVFPGSTFNFNEYGLPVPTLADAFSKRHSPQNFSEFESKLDDSVFDNVSDVLAEYDLLGRKLASTLGASFRDFYSLSIKQSSSERTSCSAIDLLHEMVDKLVSETSNPLPHHVL